MKIRSTLQLFIIKLGIPTSEKNIFIYSYSLLRCHLTCKGIPIAKPSYRYIENPHNWKDVFLY